MTDHQRKADEVERELYKMQERSEKLEGDISSTSEDWEQKKRDGNVPGAGGDGDRGEEDSPEADQPAKD